MGRERAGRGGGRRGRPITAVAAAVAATALGLLVTGTAPPAMAQSGSGVPLWPDYPADVLPIPDTMTPRVSDVCVSVDQLYGDLASGPASQLGSYGEAPVRARYHVGLLTDLDAAAVTGAFRPYLDAIDPIDDQPTQLWGGAGELIVNVLWMEGQSNVWAFLPPDQALAAQAALPPFPEERSDLPDVDTLRVYEICHGYYDSLGGSLGSLRFHEGAQVTGQELVDELTERRGGSEGFESFVFDDGGARVVWQDGDHRVSISLDAYERISEVIYLPLTAVTDAEDDGLPVGAAGQDLDREDDEEAADTGGAGTDASAPEGEVEGDGAVAAVPVIGVTDGDDATGLGVGVWIGAGILGLAAVAGGMAISRRKRPARGGATAKEPVSAAAAAAPKPLRAPPSTPPPPPRASGGPLPPPVPRASEEPPPPG